MNRVLAPIGMTWARWTLRTRVTLLACLVLSVAIAVGSIALLAVLRTSLLRNLDTVATQRASDLAAQAQFDRLPRPIPGSPDNASIVQVLDASGQVLAQSADLDGNEPLFPTPLPAPLRRQQPITLARLPIADNDRFRVVARPTTVGGRPAMVVAAVSQAQADGTINLLSVALLIGGPAVVATVGTITWLLAGLTVRSVESLRAQTADISASDLHRRLRLADPPREVDRLTATLNDMLDRLERSAAGQRQFIADAAHELRSPLTAVAVQLELLERQPYAARSPELIAAIRGDVERLQALVEDLLALARAEDAAPRWRRQVIDLDDIVLSEIRRTGQLTSHVVDARGVSAGQVLGEPEALRRVVRNLLDNATRHAEHRITVTLTTQNGSAGPTIRLTISDDGPGIPERYREAVFDRFTRLDEARTRDLGGSGLGLAIVRQILTAHHGTVEATAAPGQASGAQFVVRLPAVGPDDDGSVRAVTRAGAREP